MAKRFVCAVGGVGLLLAVALVPVGAKATTSRDAVGASTESTPVPGAGTQEDMSCETTPYPPAPAGFDPLSATAVELAKFGFPQRPAGDDTSSAVASWAQMVANAKYQDTLGAPDCVPTAAPVHFTTYYGGYWAGRVVPASYIGASSFTWAESEWTVPILNRGNPDYSECDANAVPPSAGAWVGIGIYNIIQSGSVSCQESPPVYKMWNEDYPQPPHFVGPAISAGDLVSVEVTYVGGDECDFFETNETTGHYMNPANTNCVNHAGNYADFILERLEPYYLPGFATFRQDANYMGDSSHTYGLLSGSGNNDLYEITSDCTSSGTVLSLPGSVNDTDHGFDQHYYASAPVCNS